MSKPGEQSYYEKIGHTQDVSEDAVDLARRHPMFQEGARPLFVAADFESLEYREEFDAVIYHDALHHALDEEASLRRAFQALKPGGVADMPGRALFVPGGAPWTLALRRRALLLFSLPLPRANGITLLVK